MSGIFGILGLVKNVPNLEQKVSSSSQAFVGLSLSRLLSEIGLNNNPRGTQTNMKVPIIIKVQLQPKLLSNRLRRGAMIKVPMSEPLDAILAANARFFSKLIATITVIAKSIRPRPRPKYK